MIARPYQVDSIKSVNEAFIKYRKVLGVLPTGAGKSLIFSWLAKEQEKRTLILAHREELIDQAISKLHSATGLVASKEKADCKASLDSKVVVGSIQTMQGKRLQRWPVDHFGLVVIDEAHHSCASSHRKILSHFDGHAKVLGVTATPDRADKKNLGSYFEHIAVEVHLWDLVHQGYLSPISIRALPIKIDLNGCKRIAGDYAADDVAAKIEPHLRAVARAIKEHALFRKTLVFLPLIATSQLFASICLQEGLSAGHVDGQSPDRKEILERFRDGDIDILSNAMLLTEGYDEPSIDCIIMLRPTRSRALYSQAMGRGTRIHPGKRDLLALDFLWLHEKHDLIRPAHLIASTQEEAEEITKSIEESGELELDLEDMQGTAREEREKKLREEMEAKARRQQKEVSAVQFALSVQDKATVEYKPQHPADAQKPFAWQLQALEEAGINSTTVKFSGHANQLLALLTTRQKLGLATAKQVRLLKQLGHPSPETATKKQAGAFIGMPERRQGIIRSYPRKVAD